MDPDKYLFAAAFAIYEKRTKSIVGDGLGALLSSVASALPEELDSLISSFHGKQETMGGPDRYVIDKDDYDETDRNILTAFAEKYQPSGIYFKDRIWSNSSAARKRGIYKNHGLSTMQVYLNRNVQFNPDNLGDDTQTWINVRHERGAFIDIRAVTRMIRRLNHRILFSYVGAYYDVPSVDMSNVPLVIANLKELILEAWTKSRNSSKSDFDMYVELGITLGEDERAELHSYFGDLLAQGEHVVDDLTESHAEVPRANTLPRRVMTLTTKENPGYAGKNVFTISVERP